MPRFKYDNLKLIGLSGKKHSGKDTIFEILGGKIPVCRLAFADALKREVARAFGVGVDEVEEYKELYRPILQAWGMLRRELKGPDYWINQISSALCAKYGETPDATFVITDVRLPNEFEYVRNLGGRMVRVVRPGHELDDSHISETALDDFDFDHVISARDRSSLEISVGKFLKWFESHEYTGASES